MKLSKCTLLLFLILFQFSYGKEHHKLPNTLKQAVRYLNRDCPDSIKQKMRITPDDELDNLFYPSYGKYEAVFDWFVDDDNKFLGINKYLIDKRIEYYAKEITLVAFKEFLVFGKFNENEIIDRYLKIEKYRVEQDKIRYTTDTLFGIYIPKDMEDCFRVLDKKISDSLKHDIKKMTADSFLHLTYRSFGMYLRNSWQLWGGSRFSKYLRDYGNCEAEGMSLYVLDNYYNYLQGKEINLIKNDTFCDQYYKQRRLEEDEKKKEEFSKYKIGDTVEYDYPNGYIDKKQENAFYDDKCITKGIIVEKDDKGFGIKVKLLTTCSRKGLIYSDNKNVVVYFNPETKLYVKPKERKILYVRKSQIFWYNYLDWRINEEE